MVIHMRVTHRGNFDGVNYTIEHPRSLRSLRGEGGEFMPLHIPENASTSFGEVYAEDTRQKRITRWFDPL